MSCLFLIRVNSRPFAVSLSVDGSINASASITVCNGGTLLLGNAASLDRIGNGTGITMAGGTLGIAPTGTGVNAIREGTGAQRVDSSTVIGTSVVGLGALTLSASSTLDFGASGVGTLNFASIVPGAFTLNIINYTSTASGLDLNVSGIDGINDRLIFNQDISAAGFLGRISFDGRPAAQISLDGGFYEIVPVPEPSTWIFAGLLCLVVGRSVASILAFRKRSSGRSMVVFISHNFANTGRAASGMNHQGTQ